VSPDLAGSLWLGAMTVASHATTTPTTEAWPFAVEELTSQHVPNALASVRAFGDQHSPRTVAASLDAALQRRPSVEVLTQRGILRGSVELIDAMESGAFPHRTESELELDMMEKGESARPGDVEGEPNMRRPSVSLSEILGCEPSIDDWLHDEEEGEVSPHVPNKINHFLEKKRPSKDLLIEAGILKTQVQQVSDHLARKSIASQIEKAMQVRPSTNELIERGIIQSHLQALP